MRYHAVFLRFSDIPPRTSHMLTMTIRQLWSTDATPQSPPHTSNSIVAAVIIHMLLFVLQETRKFTTFSVKPLHIKTSCERMNPIRKTSGFAYGPLKNLNPSPSLRKISYNYNSMLTYIPVSLFSFIFRVRVRVKNRVRVTVSFRLG